MNNKQIRNFFLDKEKVACPLTDALVAAGYQQKSGGYITYARQCHINAPSQYWHLIESWSNRSSENAPFTKSIQCGELLFWMAEVSHAVSEEELSNLKNTIIQHYLHNRKVGNRMIQAVCFDKIVAIVDAYNHSDDGKDE